MVIVHVHIRVKEEHIDTFKNVTIENAQCSIKEGGVRTFDIIQQLDNPACFVLIESYRDEAASAAHKQTIHYQTWRDRVSEILALPRTSVKYRRIFPNDGADPNIEL